MKACLFKSLTLVSALLIMTACGKDKKDAPPSKKKEAPVVVTPTECERIQGIMTHHSTSPVNTPQNDELTKLITGVELQTTVLADKKVLVNFSFQFAGKTFSNAEDQIVANLQDVRSLIMSSGGITTVAASVSSQNDMIASVDVLALDKANKTVLVKVWVNSNAAVFYFQKVEIDDQIDRNIYQATSQTCESYGTKINGRERVKAANYIDKSEEAAKNSNPDSGLDI